MSDDQRDFRHICVAVLVMLVFAVLALMARDAGYRLVGQSLMAGCIASFGFTLTTFSRFLRRHGSREHDDG